MLSITTPKSFSYLVTVNFASPIVYSMQDGQCKMAASQIFILTAVLYLQILMCINSEFYKINIIRYNKTILTNSKLYFG